MVVKNAKEAIEALREREYDLVVTDINMPRMNGFDLMKRIRRKDISLPILLVSGALLEPEEEKIIEESDVYLRKPFDMEELHKFIVRGLSLRVKMKKLVELVDDDKKMRKLIKGKIKLEKVVKEEENLALAQELLKEVYDVA